MTKSILINKTQYFKCSLFFQIWFDACEEVVCSTELQLEKNTNVNVMYELKKKAKLQTAGQIIWATF